MLTTEEAKSIARRLIRRGTVHTYVTHVSKSGMSRNITPIVATKRGEIRDLSQVCLALGIGSKPRGGGDGVTMGGCGMDMGFALVYRLSQIIYGDGYVIDHKWA